VARIAVLCLLLSGCSGASDASNSELVIASADTGRTSVRAGAGVTNLLSAKLTAPIPGTLSASATGTCYVEQTLPVTSGIAVDLETTATDDFPQAGEAVFLLGDSGDVGSFSTQRTMLVPSGPQTIYLNLNNPSSGGTLGCNASLTLILAG